MNRRILSGLLFIILLLLSGCIRQRPVFSADPTPGPTPTPTPPPVTQSLPPQKADTDALGAQILDESHFLRYLTFVNLRVYEYAGGTLFDGVCKNSYPQTLTGSFELVFTEKDGTVVARAPVVTRAGNDEYQPGETVLYAQIDTDMDIQMLPFSLQVTQQIMQKSDLPVSAEGTNIIGG